MQILKITTVRITIFIFLLNIANFIHSQTVNWNPHPRFIVSSFQIINPVDITGRAASLTSYTSPSYTGIIPSDVEICFGINGLSIYESTYQFSYVVKAYSINDTNFQFSVTLYGQTVIHRLVLNAALIGKNMVQVFYKYQQHTCKVLNKGQGIRSQNITIPVSLKPSFKPTAGKISMMGFIQGLSMYNNQSLDGNELYLGITYSVNYTHWTILCQTRSSIITFINIAFIVVDRFMSQDVYGLSRLFLTARYNCPGTNCPASNTSFINYKFIDTGNIFFGLQHLCLKKHSTIQYFLDTSNLNNLNQSYTRNQNITCGFVQAFSVAMRQCVNASHFYHPSRDQCIPDCSAYPSYPHENTDRMVCSKCHYTCTACVDQGPDNCTSCASSYRQAFPNSSIPQFSCVCMDGHFDHGRQWCPFCSTYMFGCDKCTSYTVCTSCMTGFVQTSPGVCACNNSSLFPTTNGSCIGIVGCIAFVVNDTTGAIYCTQCNQKKNFILENYVCICPDDHNYNSTGKLCYPKSNICGDGILNITAQQCDDGNLNVLDGCDILCKVEIGYECYTRYKQSSVCIQQKTNLTYIGAMKHRGDPHCVLYFSIESINPHINTIQTLIQFILTNLTLNTSFSNFKLNTQRDDPNQRLILTIQFDYSQNIDPNITHNISLYLTDDYYSNHQFKISTNFTIIGANLNLVMHEEIQNYTVLNYMFLVMIILAYVAALISIFSERWIGIELIHTIQFCFFYFILLNQIDEKQINFLYMLQLSNGFNSLLYQMNYFEYITFNKKLYMMNFKKEFFLNFNITIILFFIPLLLVICKYLIPIVIQCCSQKKKKNKQKKLSLQYLNQSLPQSLKVIFSQEFIVGKVFVAINLLFINQIIISYFIQQSMGLSLDEVGNHLIELVITFVFLTSIIFTIGIIMLGAIRPFKIRYKQYSVPLDTVQFIKFKLFSPNYACIYTLFNTSKIILLCLFLSFQHSVYIIISLDIFYFIGFCIFRPYKNQLKIQQPNSQYKQQINQNQQQQLQEIKKKCNQQFYPLHNFHNMWNLVGLIGLSIYITQINSGTMGNRYLDIVMIRYLVLIVCAMSVVFGYLRLFCSGVLRRCANSMNIFVDDNFKRLITKDVIKLDSKNNKRSRRASKYTLQQTARQLQQKKISSKLHDPDLIINPTDNRHQNTSFPEQIIQNDKQQLSLVKQKLRKQLKYVPYENKQKKRRLRDKKTNL